MPYRLYYERGCILQDTQADLMVNSSNTSLLLGSGVSLAFKRHYGHELQQAMLREKQIFESDRGRAVEPGDVLQTCHLPDAKIAHAAVLRCCDRQNTSLEVVYQCLVGIEQLLPAGDTRLVMPLLATGAGGLSQTPVKSLYETFFSRPIEAQVDVLVRVLG